MRTLVATVLSNNKGNDIYCAARKVSEKQINTIRLSTHKQLEEAGFTFIKMLSLEYPNIKGYAIFYEGHLNEMNRNLKTLEKNIYKKTR